MRLVLLLFLFYSNIGFSQVFNFENTSFTFVKNVNQSPVHWYLEIHNLIDADTNLRWKTRFVNIPPEWVINFDDQTNNISELQDGDSADFVLQSDLSFPQKLIIGNTLNNTTGHGFVYFDIFNPSTPNEVQTIYFEFIISPASSLSTLSMEQQNVVLFHENCLIPTKENHDITILDFSGKVLLRTQNAEKICLEDFEQPIIVKYSDETFHRTWKFYRSQ